MRIAVLAMKIVGYDEKKRAMKVTPENVDDLWVLYNVIRGGDGLYARTSRVIKTQEEGARPTKGKRVALSLGVRVEKIAFQKGDNRLRVMGVVTRAPEELGLLGSHHTITIALRKPVTIVKEAWHSFDLTRLEQASRETSDPLLIVSVDDEKGCVAVLHHRGLDIRAEIEARLPGKLEVEKRDVALTRYFNSILKELLKVWSESHGLVAVVGPGFWKDKFVNLVRGKHPQLHKAISEVRTVGNGGAAGIEEAMRSGALNVVAKKIRAIEETKAVDEVLSRLGSNRRAVSYGAANVTTAIRYGAVDRLLIADAFLREADDESRRSLENSMRDVERMGGRVTLVSTEHEAGKNLSSLGGIAALLRFPVD